MMHHKEKLQTNKSFALLIRATFSFRILILIFILTRCVAAGQNTTPHNLVRIKQLIPDAVVDMPYATEDNFAGKILYSANEAFLVEPAALALASAAAELRKQGYRLKILDAYRPLSVQAILWKIKPDPNFVASPITGSRHNRGASVDVTIVRTDLEEVEMPCKYDDFGPQASAFNAHWPPQIQENVTRLQNSLTNNGFATLKSEWWHFDYNDWKSFPLLDSPFEALK